MSKTFRYTVTPTIIRMAADVKDYLHNQPESSYKEAFAYVAHQNGIFHNENKERYNHHFQAVMAQIKKEKGGRELIKAACSRPNYRPKEQRLRSPLPAKEDIRRLAANDSD